MYDQLYNYRFELFLSTLFLVLFGALIFPGENYTQIASPALALVNQLAGLLILSKKRVWLWVLAAVVAARLLMALTNGGMGYVDRPIHYAELALSFLFYGALTYEVIQQVWNTSQINHKVLFGLVSAYMCIGLLGFFMCLSIELHYPGSFKGVIIADGSSQELVDRLIYYSYITLLTIGYGEIVPVTSLAQKAAVVIGVTGQFYFVIFTATMVGKFVSSKEASGPG